MLNSNKKIQSICNRSITAYQNKLPYHYVYVHKLDDVVIYVGKGSFNRAVRIAGRSDKWYKFTYNRTSEIKVEIITDLLENKEALILEKETIRKYKNTCINQQIGLQRNIACLTREGDLIKIYKSTIELVMDGHRLSNVIKCCEKERGLQNNLVWMYEEEYNSKAFNYKKATNHSKWIIQKTKDNRFVRKLLTANAFANFGFRPKIIQQVCVGKKKSHYGFIFSYE